MEPRADAADLLNETLVVAWKRIREIPDNANEERAWLYGVAANVLANHRRSNGRRSKLVQRMREQLTEPTDSVADFDMTHDVGRAIDLLDASDSELIRLVHWDRLSASEAGRVMGLPESTARARYAAARRTLRVSLTDFVGRTPEG